MTFDEACGIRNASALTWASRIDAHIRYIGQDNIRPYLPLPIGTLILKYAEDPNFNNTPMALWNKAAGAPGFEDRQGQKPPVLTGPFPAMLAQHRVTSYALSESVALLKRCAELEVLDRLKELAPLAAAAAENRPISVWAVLSRQCPAPDPMSRHNIFDFGCEAVFASEQEAVKYEDRDPEQRVRKQVRIDPESIAKIMTNIRKEMTVRPS